MKRLVAGLVVATLLFVAVYQAFRYHQLETEVEALLEEQNQVFEDNKRLIAAISLLTSPSRILRLAEEELGMELTPRERERILSLEPSGRSESASGSERRGE